MVRRSEEAEQPGNRWDRLLADRCILVVDGDDLVRQSLGELLTDEGYTVLEASNGREALNLLRKGSVDLVVSEVRLPDIGGLEVLKQIRVNWPHVAVILLTGYSSLESAIGALRCGAADYLLKPCPEEELLGRIEAALACRRVRDRLIQIGGDLSATIALVRAIETREWCAQGHAERVAHHAARLAGKIGRPQEEVRQVWLAGLLHDIGKVAVRKAILNKPAPLTRKERDLVRQHPRVVAEILAPIPHLRSLVPLIRHHHERFDGTGYPDGLAGEQIPLGARILAVVDAYEAMTSERPYRPALPDFQVRQVLQEGAGTQWDPDLVACWVSLVREEPTALPVGSEAAPVALGVESTERSCR